MIIYNPVRKIQFLITTLLVREYIIKIIFWPKIVKRFVKIVNSLNIAN